MLPYPSFNPLNLVPLIFIYLSEFYIARINKKVYFNLLNTFFSLGRKSMTDEIFKDLPHESPIQPLQLSAEDTIQFRCHPDIACFNQCCQCSDIQLTPYDILRLKNRFGLTSNQFLSTYTVPFEMDSDGMPGVKILTKDDGACPFVEKKGCSVYEDRPSTCRYYPIGLLSMREQDSPTDEDYFFIVKEEHCLGHQEPRELTIGQYRQEQNIIDYDEINREWRQIVLKKRSAGPGIGKPSIRSYQFFFLLSYNLDGFRDFIQTTGFSEVYDVDAATLEQLKTDELALLQFSFKLLKQVLFGEMNIPVKADATEKRQQRRQS